jgi:drug/metabolite transporter (DMT)-like permease
LPVSSHLRGVLFMLGAVGTLSVLDVGLKQLAASYPTMQVAFLRGVSSLPLVLLALGIFGRFGQLATRRWQFHALRAVLGLATLWFFIYAVNLLSLGDAYAIFMFAPLLITALSMVLLGDRMDAPRWIAVCVGLAGGLAALAAATGYALSVVTIRMMAQTDSNAATVVWYMVGLTLLSGIAAWSSWHPWRWADWPWLAVVGVAGALGQYLITAAFRHAPPSLVAPIEYTALAWGMLFDWLLWMVAPSLRMLIGAGIIVASGLYVLHREANQPAQPAVAAVPSSE